MASFLLAEILTSLGRFDDARVLLDGLEREFARRDELFEAKTLWLRSRLELNAGRWSVARDHAERERELAALYERPAWSRPLAVGAELALFRGELDQARRLAVSRARGRRRRADGSVM
jgi:ATP/maltotriose-dependent transcriptional regulator MalT